MDAAADLMSSNPLRRGGRSCLWGHRTSVGDVLGWLALGMSPEQIAGDYPELSPEDSLACLAYATWRETRGTHETRGTRKTRETRGTRGTREKARSSPACTRLKLLLHEHLSRRLVPALQARFPGSSQVVLLGPARATDGELCDDAAAAANACVNCSNHDDFQRLVAARGYNPGSSMWGLETAAVTLRSPRCWRWQTGFSRPSTIQPAVSSSSHG